MSGGDNRSSGDNRAGGDSRSGGDNTYGLEDVGPALRRLRKARGLRQGEVAAKMGISRNGPSRYEQPGTNLQLSNLLGYLDALGATFDDLHRELTGEVEKDPLNAALDEQIRISDERMRDEPAYRRLAMRLLERFGGPEVAPELRALAELIDEQDRRLRKLEARSADDDESPAGEAGES